MIAFLIVLLLLAVFYASAMVYVVIGFRRVARTELPALDSSPDVSIVIAARNEEGTIGACLASIRANAYPPDHLEIVVVDDGSDDATADVVRRAAADAHPARVRLISLAEGGAGKLAALRAGIAASTAAFILTTDADCKVGPRWVEAMVSCLSRTADYVAGPVVFHHQKGMWSGIQALEFLGLVAVGAGAIGVGHPVLSNGANAGFRRKAYEAVGGHDEAAVAATGDDDVLMQRIAYERGGRIRFCAAPDALVATDPPDDFTAFVQQRLRWGATAPRYRHGRIRGTLVVIYVFYVMLLVGAIVAPFSAGVAVAWFAAVLLKLVPEYLLLREASRHFGRLHWLRWFVPGQVLHVPYIVLFPAAGVLLGYRWKDRPMEP